MNPKGVRDLPSGCDKAILMSHSKGYPDAFSIQFKYYNGYLPSYQLKPNVDVIGCHLAGVRAHKGKDARGIPTKFPNRPGGVGNRGLVKSAAMEKLIEKVESLKEKDCCPKVTTILLATTDDELHRKLPEENRNDTRYVGWAI